MKTSHHNIHERSNSIPIKQNLSILVNKHLTNGEYSLKQNFFDPSKNTPPNVFMIKLHMRMNQFYMDKKDDSFDIE
jgi:hypothetical protein